MILGKYLFTIIVGIDNGSPVRVYAVMADTIEAAMAGALEADEEKLGAANDPSQFELARHVKPQGIKVMRAEVVPGDHTTVVV